MTFKQMLLTGAASLMGIAALNNEAQGQVAKSHPLHNKQLLITCLGNTPGSITAFINPDDHPNGQQGTVDAVKLQEVFHPDGGLHTNTSYNNYKKVLSTEPDQATIDLQNGYKYIHDEGVSGYYFDFKDIPENSSTMRAVQTLMKAATDVCAQSEIKNYTTTTRPITSELENAASLIKWEAQKFGRKFPIPKN
jgi:hypothetical protein